MPVQSSPLFEDRYEDQTLQCCQCHRSFTYTARQQEEHRRKGYTHKPKRCSSCRSRKRNGNGNGKGKMNHEETTTELCKAVTELRIFIDQEFKRLHRRLDVVEEALEDAMYEEDDSGT